MSTRIWRHLLRTTTRIQVILFVCILLFNHLDTFGDNCRWVGLSVSADSVSFFDILYFFVCFFNFNLSSNLFLFTISLWTLAGANIIQKCLRTEMLPHHYHHNHLLNNSIEISLLVQMFQTFLNFLK